MSRQNPTVIIALGGNAISPKNESGNIEKQFEHTRESLNAMMHFVKERYNICITHGNGPQVGAELLKNEITKDTIPSLPLGILVANTQGAIGYMIQQTLQNALQKKDVDREVVTFISQVIVDKNDPTIKNPTKFIGKSYSKEEAFKLSDEFNWSLFDFLVMGTILLTMGILINLIIDKLKKRSFKFLLIIVTLLVFALIYLELAVGIFGTPFAGS